MVGGKGGKGRCVSGQTRLKFVARICSLSKEVLKMGTEYQENMV